MVLDVSSLSPAACGAYVDARAAPAASRLLGTAATFAFSDNQLACLISGAVALVLLFGIYCCGCACRCFQHFDYFSTDFWIDAGDADADEDGGAESGDGHLQPLEYGGGVSSKKSLKVVPRLKKVGGVAVWAGVALGAALCGDLLSWVTADEGCVSRGASRARSPLLRALSCTDPPPSSLRQRCPNGRVGRDAPVRFCRRDGVVDAHSSHGAPAPAEDV